MIVHFDIEAAWRPYDAVLSIAKFAAAVKQAVALLGEPLVEVLPSIIHVPDGPKLDSIFLLTESLLCEASQDGQTFDYVSRLSVRNIRWSFGSVSVAGSDGEPVKAYETAVVTLSHFDAMHSSLSYVGEDRSAWIHRVAMAFPSSSVAACGHGPRI